MTLGNEIITGIFIVKEIDMIPTKINNVLTKIKNKIFSKVSRICAVSLSRETEITIDINTEIYEIHESDKLEFCIVQSTLQKNIEVESYEPWLNLFEKSLLDSYEYVMYGTIFHSGIEGEKFFLYASFGGLLMKIFGNIKISETKINLLKIDSKILLCIRKL